MAAGNDFTLALGTDGKVYGLGDNTYGQLGQGDRSEANGSVKLADMTELSNIVYIAAGGYHALAVDETGRTYVWGRNDNGQLGNGTTYNSVIAH